MLERVLVPLDGSDLAAAILPRVRGILFYKDAEIILVQGVYVPANAAAEGVDLPDILRAQAARYLDGVARTLSSQGARVRTVARIGSAAEVVLDVAAEEKASLIMMSTHGRSGIARWIRGSVTEKVLRSSRVPVLAVRSFPAAPAPELSLKHILVPLEATDISREVVGPALELATLFKSRVTLLHVCDGPACSVPVPDLVLAYERFHERGIEVEPVMKQGDPALQILDTARDLKADLIAMTTHGRAGVSRWALGSVAEKVLRAAEVPLLLVRTAKA
jgi:nucleotide-binding universal stress UspA family protein